MCLLWSVELEMNQRETHHFADSRFVINLKLSVFLQSSHQRPPQIQSSLQELLLSAGLGEDLPRDKQESAHTEKTTAG